ncbi:hypothetical protein PsorP6_002961 [Peronosclerospora sorghi]|uniref:Uncharacterized protein n=1 Tax=Peronosclerospora sorghi TaxID=230839 RepID=A0ACC0VME8_9STRA|nr:hypothetical protein PsorP6_002961 [Peronosclerospora sorghi]
MPASVWAHVQGECNPAQLEQALEGNRLDPRALLDGWTPLHYLCENRGVDPAARAQGVRLLLDAGCDVNAVDESGLSPLHLLCQNKSGSDIVPSLQQLVLAKAKVHLQTTHGQKVALHCLCANETVTDEALEVLLRAGSNVNAVDADGNTPQHYLGENGSVTERMVSLLLAAKANLNIQNNYQATPAHYICQNSRVTQRMISDMLNHKANFNVKDNLGKLASDYIPSGKKDCVAFLRQFVTPHLVPTRGCSILTTEIGGEDPSELPEPLKTALTAWNASLPPFDATFYNVVSCEPAFESIYNNVQDVSGRACENPSDRAILTAWEKSLSEWRACILLAYAALVPPNIWHQYAERFQRSLPTDLMKALGQVETAWKQFPEQTQRRSRFQALANVFTTAL